MSERVNQARLAELYRAGRKVSDIAHEMGMTPWSVFAHLRRMGLNGMRRHLWRSGKRVTYATLAAAYAEGDEVTAIAARYQVSASTVWQAVRKTGAAQRRPATAEKLRGRPRGKREAA